MVKRNQIEAIVQSIAERFHPERIILFGSYAYGKPSEYSDVDLLVVMPFEGRGFYKGLEILRSLDVDFSVDVFVRRPDEVEWRYTEGDPLIGDALDYGKVLYDKSHKRVA